MMMMNGKSTLSLSKKSSMSKSPKGKMANKNHEVPTTPMPTRMSMIVATNMNADKKMVS